MNEMYRNLLGADIAPEKGLLFGLQVLGFMRRRATITTSKPRPPRAPPTGSHGSTPSSSPASSRPTSRAASRSTPTPRSCPCTTPTTRYTGGTVVLLFVREEITNPASVAELVKVICSRYRLPYFAITPTFSICPNHGYLRPVNEWNEGKVEEFKQRRTFKIVQGV